MSEMFKKDKGQKRHDAYVEKLVEELKSSGQYDLVGQFLEYGFPGRCLGELDVYGIMLDESQIDIFDVKGTGAARCRKKAYDQLHRAEAFFEEGFVTVNLFLDMKGSWDRVL